MPYTFITLPFDEAEEDFELKAYQKVEEKYRVKRCQASFFQTNKGAYWTVFIEYEPKIVSRPDKVQLNPEQQVYYEALRTWRNERAEEDGIAPYIIAKNKQLEQIVQLEDFTLEALTSIRGIGKGKVEKYGKDITRILLEQQSEKDKDS